MPKQLTEKRLMNIALFYLERFETSDKKLRNVLRRRVSRMKSQGVEIPAETPQWIDSVLARVQELGCLNNDRYAETQVRLLVGQGRSDQYILMKLKSMGIPEKTVRGLLDTSGISELDRAKHYAQKKHIGPYRSTSEPVDKKKELGVLARAGFSYEIAVSVLGASPDTNEG